MLDALLGETPEVREIQSRCARGLFAIGVSANVATALAAAIGVISGIEFGRAELVWGIALLAVSAAFDALDGTIARECAAPSAIGGVFDLCSDRLVETAVIVGIVWRHQELYFPALVLVASWYVNITVFLSVGAALEREPQKLIAYPPGILERTEALIFFVVLALITATPVLRMTGPLLCYAMTVLEIVTGGQRLIFGWQTIRARKAEPSLTADPS